MGKAAENNILVTSISYYLGALFLSLSHTRTLCPNYIGECGPEAKPVPNWFVSRPESITQLAKVIFLQHD
jgi:hypothetical protein